MNNYVAEVVCFITENGVLNFLKVLLTSIHVLCVSTTKLRSNNKKHEYFMCHHFTENRSKRSEIGKYLKAHVQFTEITQYQMST